ncbi:MAG: hypothetical protein MSIBF_03000 [Candidatus Altiarchaeales archaeon IMC4]|nr:MAG: hypothetical protein MSIBF_03000 [Candidatus Altiarchaeales archaeon IMC4]
MKITLDLKKTVPENANFYYEGSKKAKKKAEGARKAIEDTLKKIEKLKERGQQAIENDVVKKVQRKKKWFEKFRWFESSDGFLVVGGKDATTNDILIKKHTEKHDVVFHADVHGAPFFVVKTEGKEAPPSTLEQAAQAAASYSSAWKNEVYSCDIYCVLPEQVSKTPPAGEYLPKGAFMIYGKKEWFRNTGLGIAVGVRFGQELEVLGGPTPAIEKACRYFVKIGIGSKKSGEIAKEIKTMLMKNAKPEDIEGLKTIAISDIQPWIPGGKGAIVK